MLEIPFHTSFEVGDQIGLALELVADLLDAGFDPSEGCLEEVVERDQVESTRQLR